MTASLDAALTATATRLHVNPQVDKAARHALEVMITTAYDNRPAAMRDMTRAEHRARLSDTTLTALYAHCALSLGGHYGRAAAHLLHTLDSWAPRPAAA
ncbi:hypothetical protein OG455_27860 [Kitasatospora sp. NBC_01287]|uniref:hypothetical protein n=1 Tax=Kitasatospora sp. NBC_01287 TaxID=2903573 RepID=UPI002257C231|nr:hypothetical protein [Kitasatospora sp. NBC_01287]MCX4749278.1 hypothetical protein [Kitasatospora sp. NBC_01287]